MKIILKAFNTMRCVLDVKEMKPSIFLPHTLPRDFTSMMNGTKPLEKVNYKKARFDFVGEYIEYGDKQVPIYQFVWCE